MKGYDMLEDKLIEGYLKHSESNIPVLNQLVVLYDTEKRNYKDTTPEWVDCKYKIKPEILGEKLYNEIKAAKEESIVIVGDPDLTVRDLLLNLKIYGYNDLKEELKWLLYKDIFNLCDKHGYSSKFIREEPILGLKMHLDQDVMNDSYGVVPMNQIRRMVLTKIIVGLE